MYDMEHNECSRGERGRGQRHHEEDTDQGGRGHHGYGEHDHGHRGGGGRRGHGGMRSGRKLSSSDLHLVLLTLLADKPSHGYELMKALEEHSHGLYAPSPGMIYPALTYLEEIGYALVEAEGAKKRYSVTESGRGYYEERRETATRILTEMERIGAETQQAREAYANAGVAASDVEAFSDELDEARHQIRRAMRDCEPTGAEAKRIAQILLRAADEIRRRP
ncbi:MAG: PadR family transcriptional regulator [Capsulimonadaceae bacterium]|nr:PadR family transcriptional regulator [Capsulimonadaceae bacterium]